MNDGVALVVDVNSEKILEKVKAGYCDAISNSIDEGLSIVTEAKEKGRAMSLGISRKCG